MRSRRSDELDRMPDYLATFDPAKWPDDAAWLRERAAWIRKHRPNGSVLADLRELERQAARPAAHSHTEGRDRLR